MEQKNLKEIYNSVPKVITPKKAFRMDLCNLTGKREQTIKGWLSGTQVPKRHHVELLAEHFGVDPDTLFSHAKENAVHESEDDDTENEPKEET